MAGFSAPPWGELEVAKEDVRDWDGSPLFPGRQVNPPIVVDLGASHQDWLERILDLFEPDRVRTAAKAAQRRAAGWRAGQALQWATSSVQAGLGYLVRQAVRANLTPTSLPGLRSALLALRPYRMGPVDEDPEALFQRIAKEVRRQDEADDVDDIEEDEEDRSQAWRPDPKVLSTLLDDGIRLLAHIGDQKWQLVWDRVLKPANGEKVVLFAQPIETVTAVSDFLERKTGKRPALIFGSQSEAERAAQVERFWDPHGPQFLVSSRAGGEGINLQVARRLVHLDVPWNPMELEQRIGRVHRFLSRKTILVDTVVVKDSREVDTYAFAREKLRTIASTLVPEDRFEALFSRVMSLVPPEELQSVMVQGPVGPLSDEDRRKLSELVTRGFEEWRTFHERYSTQQRQIGSLDPGQATWADLASLVTQHVGASAAEDFAALRFLWQEGEVREAPQTAQVLMIENKPFACGDYNGMPVTRDDGTRAERLGTNVALVAKALRALAFPEQATGAAYLRWPLDVQRPSTEDLGVLVVVRQSVRWEHGSYVEHATTLHTFVIGQSADARELADANKGTLIRTLLTATVRREAEAPTGMIEALTRAENDVIASLRRPTEADREARIVHAVTPLFAAIVT